MTEILTWGDEIQAQFDRLGIKATRTYEGGDDAPSVYEVDDEEFAILGADPEENWTGKDAGWRYATGANTFPDTFVIVNGHELEGFSRRDADNEEDEDSDEEPELEKYDTLLDHLEETLGATNGKNVAALVAELASANGMTIGALMTKYQPKDAGR